jgi:hypothetical protein
MALSPPIVAGLAFFGSAAGLGVTRAAGRLGPLARMADLKRPRMIVAAMLWATIVPMALVSLAGPSWLAPAALFAWGGLSIALMDLAAMRAPHVLSGLFALAGLGAALFLAPERAAGAALAGLGAFAVGHAARLSFRRARGYNGLGGGDPSVMGALAVWAGPWGAPWVLCLGAALALGVAGLARRHSVLQGRAPLATCLVGTSVVVALTCAGRLGTPFWATGFLP